MHDSGLHSLSLEFLKLQWCALIIPIIGIITGQFFRRLQNETGMILVSVILALFAIGWALIAIFVWQAQSVWIFD
jgi:hypothetical protein